MPAHLDRVQVQLASSRDPVELPWASSDALLYEIRHLESASGIVKAFENAGASRPVTLTPEDKARLLEVLEAWANGVQVSELPEGVWDLRCAPTTCTTRIARE